MAAPIHKTKINATYLLAAPLMFSFLCFVQLPGQNEISRASFDNPAAFLTSYLLAGATVYLCFVLFDPFRKKSRQKISSLACVLPIVAGMGLSFLFDAAHFGSDIQIPLGGALIGLGSALLFLSWGQAFSLLDSPLRLPTTAAMFSIAYLLKLAFVPFAETPLNLAIIGCAIIISALPLDWIYERQSVQNESAARKQGTLDISNTVNLGKTLLQLWKPLFGCVLCCMIWGFTWGNALQGAETPSTDNLSTMVSDLGKAAAALLLLAYGFKKTGNLTQGFLLPIAAACLLLGWMLDPLEGALGFPIIGSISAFGFAAFEIALWTKTSELAAENPTFCHPLFSATRLILICTIVLGILLAPLVGEQGAQLFTPICIVIFFVLYAATSSKTGGYPPVQEKTPGICVNTEADPRDAHLGYLCKKHGLSPRESEVFVLFVKGHSAKYISDLLIVSPHTVKTHIKRIYEKVGVHSKDELIARFSDE